MLVAVLAHERDNALVVSAAEERRRRPRRAIEHAIIDLHEEIKTGVSRLEWQDGKLVRLTRACTVALVRDGKALVETQQRLATGTLRLK